MRKFSNWLETNITLQDYDNRREERANAVTHLFGAVLSLAGMVFLISAGLKTGDSVKTAGLVVFAVSMLLLYTASGLYHLIRPSNLKRAFRILDHFNIYFLIAGTYTPVLIAVGTSLSYAFIAVVWGIAVLGIVFTMLFWDRFKVFHVILYLAMGWLIVFIWKPVSEVIPLALLKWIIAGGLFYTIGTVFYAMKKMPYYHAVWHMFVLGGSISFFLGIYMYIPTL